MWNLHDNRQEKIDLIKSELGIYNIISLPNNSYKCTVGDIEISAKSIKECLKHIDDGMRELQSQAWEEWKNLAHISEEIIVNQSQNDGSLDNILFLSNVKKSFLLSSMFSDLSEISDIIYKLFGLDVAHIDPESVSKFNAKLLQIKLLHKLIMGEIYRKNLISAYARLTKQASVSGPWANLDLPMKERVWEWDDGEEEYFDNRERARKEQVRYNPEYIKEGYFFVWQDLTRDPYKYEDMKKDSPYKSRHILSIS